MEDVRLGPLCGAAEVAQVLRQVPGDGGQVGRDIEDADDKWTFVSVSAMVWYRLIQGVFPTRRLTLGN